MTSHVVLTPGATALSGPINVPGFPGIFWPGVPIDVADLGLTEGEARDLIDAGGLPLEIKRPRSPLAKDVAKDVAKVAAVMAETEAETQGNPPPGEKE